MPFGLTAKRRPPSNEQLLKLYWNRAEVKRELRDLRREHYELLDRMKEQEGAIARSKEQLEGLERLLTDPLAAANAMVYFQLRHLWNTAAERVQQFAAELEVQREKRERAQLREAELAKRQRRLDAIDAKLADLAAKHDALADDAARLQQRLARWNPLSRLVRGPRLKRRIAKLSAGQALMQERIDELRALADKLDAEPLPDVESLSIESRRLINVATIALAQHLVLHFSEHDLASLSRMVTERAVGEMKFGDRRECDRLVEQIRERIQALRRQQNLPDLVRRRTEQLLPQMRYRDETDVVPVADCVESIEVVIEKRAGQPARRSGDAPLAVNVLNEDYWDLFKALR